MAKTRPGVIAIDIKGLERFRKSMEARSSRSKDLRPAFNRVGPITQRNVSQHFQKEEGPTKPWPKKKKKPIKFSQGSPVKFERGYWVNGKFRVKRKTGVGITGNLSRATSFRATKSRLIVFTPQKYGGSFHKGFKGTRRIAGHTQIRTRAFGRPLSFPVAVRVKGHSFKVNQPARPFLYLDRKTRTLLRELTGNYILTGRTVNI